MWRDMCVPLCGCDTGVCVMEGVLGLVCIV